MAGQNPFTPAFGTVPIYMAGREEVLDDMRRAFDGGPGDPNLSTILIGARGTGKTALLTCIADEARSAGWVAASTTALPGMLEDLYEQSVAASEHLVSRPHGRLTSLGVGPVSASWDGVATQAEGNWRTRMSRLLDQLAEVGCGLLLTVDEVRADVGELIQLAAIYQHFVTERRRVALVLAGLPYHVHRLVSDKSVSFLRRSMQRQLGRIPDADVGFALRKTFESGGKTVDQKAERLCVEAIDGFAFMLQLVGYRTWLEAPDSPEIGVAQAEPGIRAAQQYMEQYVLASTYRELSAGDLRFIRAMLADKAESRMTDIAARMGVTSGYAAKYKSRLLAAGVIGERSRGIVAFDIPGFREYAAAQE